MESSVASEMLDLAVRDGQASRRLDAGEGVDLLRAGIRALARRRGIRIRTGIVDGNVVVVVLTTSSLWTATAAVMREKLIP